MIIVELDYSRVQDIIKNGFFSTKLALESSLHKYRVREKSGKI